MKVSDAELSFRIVTRSRSSFAALVSRVSSGSSFSLSFFLTAAGSGFFLNASFVVLTIRGQESVPGSVGMLTGITLGLTVGLGGLAVTPMAVLAEWIGLPGATAVAAGMAVATALSMRLLPPLPAGAGQR